MRIKALLKPILAAALCTLLAVGAAYATITPLPIVTTKGPYVNGAVGAGSLAFVFTACDNTNGEQLHHHRQRAPAHSEHGRKRGAHDHDHVRCRQFRQDG